MKATTLTGILIGSILVVLASIVVGNWQLQAMLRAETATMNALKAETTSNSNSLAMAENLRTYMRVHKTDVDRAASIVAQTKTYQYQNQIIKDITSYATMAKLSILEFNFPEETTVTAKQTGLRSITTQVTLSTPIEYENFIRFLKYIEQNLTKMQITDISITQNTNNPKLIDSPTVGLEVYVK